MAQYVVPGPNDIFQCPFEITHTIRALGAQKHLHKCAKNHPTVLYEICPFNQIHWVKKAEFQHHLDVCPDKSRYQMILLQDQARPPIQYEPDDFDHNITGEVWEDDPNHQEVFEWKDKSSSSGYWSQHQNEIPQPSYVPQVVREQKVMQPRRANAGNFKLTPHTSTQMEPEPKPEPKPAGKPTTNAQNTLFQINKGRGAKGRGEVRPGQQPQQMPPKPLVQGIGRGKRLAEALAPGIGRGTSRRMAAAIPALQQHGAPLSMHSLAASLVQQDGSSTSSMEDEELSEMSVDEKAKRARRHTKKLKQIEALEAQRMNGKTLNAEEIAKIDSKVVVKERIRLLLEDMGPAGDH